MGFFLWKKRNLHLYQPISQLKCAISELPSFVAPGKLASLIHTHLSSPLIRHFLDLRHQCYGAIKLILIDQSIYQLCLFSAD